MIDGAQLGLEIVLEDPPDEGRNRRSSVAISWQVACTQRRTHVFGKRDASPGLNESNVSTSSR